ncbi:MAG TPA: flagella basal body P-ring formation protein FlgA [Allosphingosinicella sp.]|jgi:flagella basal body P-ring formation protein FlgA|nr:flagella basal body P-ring formation protein FlgA [Allosphingosinicella sp.]
MTAFRRFVPVLLALPVAAHAQSFQDLNALETQVIAALGAGIGEPGGPSRPIDRRLKLSPCPSPVVVEPPALGAVAVGCKQIGWRIRVPLTPAPAAAAAMQQAAAVTVKAAPIIKRGDQIELVADAGSFSVTTVAVAEQDGAPGDHIRVRPAAKPGTVVGVVSEDGRVLLPGFN